jgi:hypothetical protein
MPFELMPDILTVRAKILTSLPIVNGTSAIDPRVSRSVFKWNVGKTGFEPVGGISAPLALYDALCQYTVILIVPIPGTSCALVPALPAYNQFRHFPINQAENSLVLTIACL